VYLQALLPFFIEGASPIEPCPFWHYFLLYNRESGSLLAMFSVYEAHLTIDKIRAKVSQVLVLQPYQRQGIATKVYDLIYCFFRKNPHCF
jgi:GNAT superfamily N-acetyltransferase